MRTVVVGGGSVGMFCATGLARRGHQVVVVDRDPGPPPVGTGGTGDWERRGVMQFRLPHFFRSTVRQALLAEMPDVWDAVVAAGGVPAMPDGFPEELTGLQCRRSVFERAVWSAARREPGLVLRTGHAERVVSEGGRATGVLVDGQVVEADLVVAAAGRAGRFADDLRAPGEGGDSGFAYVTRMYRARPGVQPPDTGLPMGALYRGFLGIVFPQDDNTLSALVVRPAADRELAGLRETDSFEAAAARVPQLASWTDPGRFEPITEVMAGAGLVNGYRGQLGPDGRVPLAGLVFVGDAVCVTNPAAGRGVTLGFRQARALLGLLDEAGALTPDVVAAFDAWCATNIRPWFLDHVYWDATLLRRFANEDLDVDARIPSDVICAAAEVDPTIKAEAGPYLAMVGLPSVLDPVEERARAVLRTGWRPPYAEGPSRDELVDEVLHAAA
jgi:2-polyprenyl-6-methoxyphenol hydroxylase-like FAD-dependent oxidoreductase